MIPSEEWQSHTYQFGPDTKKRIIKVWTCDVNGRGPHNKKHTKYEGDVNNNTQTTANQMT